jgi:alkanesulfonate monooxygenase SsuD/methylene tetrahydromethanopterin reductase-like flavin-dependent oxidoreductase (luciferase family)
VRAVDDAGHPIRSSATLPFGGPTTRGWGSSLPSLGVTLPQFSAEPGPALEACREARRLGFGGAFVFDHMWPLGAPTRPALEGWTLLAALAADVGRQAGDGFRVGTMVTRAGIRAPALVARMAATVGEVAGAPPIIGVGRGDLANRDENLAFGLPFGSIAERAAAVEDTVAALRGPLAGTPRSTGVPLAPWDGDGPDPLPAGPSWGSPDPSGPEVWVGGVGPGARELAGRLADAWNAWALDPDELAAGLADVRKAAERAGRDPARVAGTWGGQVLVAPGRREAQARLARWGAGRPPGEPGRVLAGDPDTVTARLRALGDAGAAWCVAAFVGGPAAQMRALLADAAGLSGRARIG